MSESDRISSRESQDFRQEMTEKLSDWDVYMLHVATSGGVFRVVCNRNSSGVHPDPT